MAGAAGRGRPAGMDSKLGRLVREREILAYRVATECGFSARIMTEYCAGRRIIRPHHLEALANFFGVDKQDLVEDDLIRDLTGANGLMLKGEGNPLGFSCITDYREYQRRMAAKEVKEGGGPKLPGIPTLVRVAR